MNRRILDANASLSLDYQPMKWLLAEARRITPSLAFSATDAAQARAWRKKAVAALAKSLGRMPQLVPLTPRLLAREKAGGYTIEAWETVTAPGLACPFFVLIPKGVTRNSPAILCAHGHGVGSTPFSAATAPASASRNSTTKSSSPSRPSRPAS